MLEQENLDNMPETLELAHILEPQIVSKPSHSNNPPAKHVTIAIWEFIGAL